MNRIVTKSIWVYRFAAASCNNCDMEILDALTPKYDLERFGIKLVGSIRHADCMLLTGAINTRNFPRLKAIYNQAPKPFFVVAVGTCALDMGIMRGSYNCVGPAGKHLPVDVYIPGCPPRPEALISGMLKLMEKIRSKTPRRRTVRGVRKL